MRTVTKLLVSIGIFLIGGLFITLIGEATGRTKGGGPIGIVIMFGIIAAIRAVWKYKPEDESKTNVDEQKLNKN